MPCYIETSIEIGGVRLAGVTGYIDTGCQFTRLSINDMCDGLVNPYTQKATDISDVRKGKIRMVKSVGVNDRRVAEDIYSLSDSDLISRSDIGFVRAVDDFIVNGVSLGSHEVKYAYKSNSPTLIGMNILKKYKWSYEDGIFRLYDKRKRSDSVPDCMRKIRDYIFKDSMILSEVKNKVSDEFSDECINVAMVHLLGDTYYKED